MSLAADVESFFAELRAHLARSTTGIVEVRCVADLEEIVARGIGRHAESELHEDVYVAVDLTSPLAFGRSLSRGLDAIAAELTTAIGVPPPAPCATDDPARALRAVSALHARARGAVGRFVIAGRTPHETTTRALLDWLAPLYLAHADTDTTKLLVLAATPRAAAAREPLGPSLRLARLHAASVAERATLVERFLDSPHARVLLDDVPSDRAAYLEELVATARPRASTEVVRFRGAIGSATHYLLSAHQALFGDPPGDLAAHPEIAFAEALDRRAGARPLTVLLQLDPIGDAPPALRAHEAQVARASAERLARLLTHARVVVSCEGIAAPPEPLWLEAIELSLDVESAHADLRALVADPTTTREQRIGALVGLTAYAAGAGDEHGALAHGLEACRLAKDDPSRRAMTLLALGSALHRLGHDARAVRTLTEATVSATRHGQWSIAAHALVFLGGAHLRDEAPEIAVRCLDAAVACAHAAGDLALEIHARTWRGEALAVAGDDEAAVRELRAAHEMAERPSAISAQLAPQAAEIHARLGAILSDRGVHAHGRAHSQHARSRGCCHPLTRHP